MELHKESHFPENNDRVSLFKVLLHELMYQTSCNICFDILHIWVFSIHTTLSAYNIYFMNILYVRNYL
jgi:hypothetical protein